MTTTKLWTVEDLEREGAPEGRWELIDGELVEMSPSSPLSSITAARVTTVLSVHIIPRRLGEVFGADGGFVLFADRELLRVPDVSFVRAERMPAGDDLDRFPRLAPDLAVEVRSPGDRSTEVAAKVAMYHAAGVPLVWLVDPRDRTVTVHMLGRPPRTLREGDVLDGGDVLPEFRVTVADLFP